MYVCMYVCMVITYSRVWINRVRLPILLVVRWTGKIIFPCPRAYLRIWSRETGSAVPSRVSLLISVLRLNLMLTHGIPPEFRGGVHIWNRHTPSGQSRVYRVTQLRTDGVHCRESAGTGPVNLKIVPNGCCLGISPWTNQYSPLFPTPTIGMKWPCWKYMVITFSRLGINRYGYQSCSWYFLCPRSCLRIWSRQTISIVLSRVSPLVLHTQAGYGA